MPVFKIRRGLLLPVCLLGGVVLSACSGGSAHYGEQSRYEYYSEQSSCAVVMQCGYWMIPTYHVITPPMRPAPPPEPPVYVPEPLPPVTITPPEPEPPVYEPPVYVPPVIPHYPEPPVYEPPIYVPPRK